MDNASKWQDVDVFAGETGTVKKGETILITTNNGILNASLYLLTIYR